MLAREGSLKDERTPALCGAFNFRFLSALSNSKLSDLRQEQNAGDERPV